MTDQPPEAKPADGAPRWQPLGSIDRRVVGVLAEKAKTTPDTYPMSVNAIRNGCNQKSNRAPLMNVEPEDVEEALERLRAVGAVGMIEGYGRVTKYRHYLYEWLGVDKVELAVMTELLLRGAQTEGELRGRAARMEPIADLGELRPVVASLKSKGLVVPLTPEGRGHVVAHALFQPKEMQRLVAQYGAGSAVDQGGQGGESGPEPLPSPGEAQPAGPQRPMTAASQPVPPPPPLPTSAPSAVETEVIQAMQRELHELRSTVAQLRADVEELSTRQDRGEQQLSDLRDALGG